MQGKGANIRNTIYPMKKIWAVIKGIPYLWEFLLTQLLLLLIFVYQRGVSPFLGKNCRFHPSCSQYAKEAVSKYGGLQGAWLSLRRLMRCHPWGGSGHDPLP